MKSARTRKADNKRYKILVSAAVSRPSAFVLFVSRTEISRSLHADTRSGAHWRGA